MLTIKARLKKKVGGMIGAEKNALLGVGFGFCNGMSGKKIPR